MRMSSIVVKGLQLVFSRSQHLLVPHLKILFRENQTGQLNYYGNVQEFCLLGIFFGRGGGLVLFSSRIKVPFFIFLVIVLQGPKLRLYNSY